MLAGEGRSLRAQREKAQRICAFLTDPNIEAVQRARAVLRDQAPLLARSTSLEIPEAKTLSAILSDAEIISRLNELTLASAAIDSAYRNRFAERHRLRLTACQQTLQRIREHVNYRSLEPAEAEATLVPLLRRAAETFDLPPFAAADRETGATLVTLDEDLELLPSIEAGALAKLVQLREARTAPEESVEFVRLSDFLPKTQPLTDFSDAEIDAALEKLKQKLYALRELKRRVLWD
jgi:hypothetical protein